MLRRSLIISMLTLTLATLAKVSPLTRHAIDRQATVLSRDGEEQEQPPYVPLLIQIDHDSVADALTALGTIIYNRRDDILLTSVPRELLDSIDGFDGISYAMTSSVINTHMDMARAFAGVDAAHNGFGLDCGYDGSGVVVGFSDIGFDARHIAFAGHIRETHAYNGYYGTQRSAVTPAQIAEWDTDTTGHFHATHVANIMAGSYMGNPYYGVAPGSEIVATTSELNDATILAGVEDVIAYAKSHGKPAVVNLSLGSTLGPHDGTDLVCRYLSACADDAVICLSAGNNGSQTVYATQILDEANPVAEFAVKDRRSGTALTCRGYVDMWCDSPAPLEFRFGAYDTDTRSMAYTSPWIALDPEDESSTVSEETDEIWASYFNGSIKVYTEVCPLNDRFEALALVDVSCDILSDRGAWSKYIPAIGLRHTQPIHDMVNIYSDGSNLSLNSVTGSATKVSSDGSISDLATAEGVIAVGMCRSRNEAPKFPEGIDTWNFDINRVSPYSSYSNTPAIAPLPQFCAPGEMVVSALSTPYYHEHPDLGLSCQSVVDGTPYYWFPECGTSMSSPYTAGVFALWLQANPNLTARELLDIAESTALRDYPDITDPRWGAGCIDALAGLRHVIAGVTDISASASPLIEINADRTVSVTIPGGNPADFSIFTSSGTMLTSNTPLLPGIYIISVPGYKPVKTIIK